MLKDIIKDLKLLKKDLIQKGGDYTALKISEIIDKYENNGKEIKDKKNKKCPILSMKFSTHRNEYCLKEDCMFWLKDIKDCCIKNMGLSNLQVPKVPEIKDDKPKSFKTFKSNKEDK